MPRLVRLLIRLYLLALVLLALTLHFGGDRWWWATLPLYAPRWLFAVPLPFLTFGAWFLPGRGTRLPNTLALIACGLLLLFPIMSFQFPWAAWLAPKTPELVRLRVLEANVDREALDGAALARVIEREKPDVVALCEWSDQVTVPWPPGWRVIRPGPELLIASRLPLDEAAVARVKQPDTLQTINHALAVLRVGEFPVPLWLVHLESPRIGLSQVASRRTLVNPAAAPLVEAGLRERMAASRLLAARCGLPLGTSPLVVGDFNMPSDSGIFRDTWGHLTNGFEVAGLGFGHTIWAEIGPFAYGARIDHQLAGPGWRCVHAHVGPYIGSDHRPTIVDWVLTSRMTGSTVDDLVPAAGLPTRAVADSFDDVPTGALPPGWQAWRDGRLASVAIESAPGGAGRAICVRSDDSGATSRAWIVAPFTADVRVGIDLDLNDLIPAQLVVRGKDLGTRVPTGLALEVVRGLEARLVSITPDSTVELARVKSRTWWDTGPIRLTLEARGDRLRARLTRPDGPAVLSPAGEWEAGGVDSLWTLSVTVPAPAPHAIGQIALGRRPGYAGTLRFDNIDVTPAGR